MPYLYQKEKIITYKPVRSINAFSNSYTEYEDKKKMLSFKDYLEEIERYWSTIKVNGKFNCQ